MICIDLLRSLHAGIPDPHYPICPFNVLSGGSNSGFYICMANTFPTAVSLSPTNRLLLRQWIPEGLLTTEPWSHTCTTVYYCQDERNGRISKKEGTRARCSGLELLSFLGKSTAWNLWSREFSKLTSWKSSFHQFTCDFSPLRDRSEEHVGFVLCKSSCISWFDTVYVLWDSEDNMESCLVTKMLKSFIVRICISIETASMILSSYSSCLFFNICKLAEM